MRAPDDNYQAIGGDGQEESGRSVQVVTPTLPKKVIKANNGDETESKDEAEDVNHNTIHK